MSFIQTSRHRWGTIASLGCLLLLADATFTDSANAQFGNSYSTTPLSGNAASTLGSRITKGAQESAAPHSSSRNVVLREGTLVGPIRGRLVLRGQRWLFIVKDYGSTSNADLKQLVNEDDARRVPPSPDTVLEQDSLDQRMFGSNESGIRSSDRTRTGNRSIGQAQSNARGTSRRMLLPEFESIIVIENLMLGRIASSIKDDPADDHWTITGRLTEFQNENRLMLITAQRSSK